MSGHLPEKDGILACLLITEMVARNGKPIHEILNRIYGVYGRLYSDRIDIALKEEKKSQLMDKLKSQSLKEFAGIGIARYDLRDGAKLYLKDKSWILFRASGTEPIVRIYFESKSKKVLSALKKSSYRISKF
jgi:phosphomannomutase